MSKNKASKAKEIAQAAKAAGKDGKFDKQDLRSLREQGMGDKKIKKVASAVGTVGNKAASKLGVSSSGAPAQSAGSPQQKAMGAKQIAQAAKAAGSKLNRSEVRDLQGQGYSAADVSSVADAVLARGGRMGGKAENALTNMQAKERMAAGLSGAPSISQGLEMVGTKLSRSEVGRLSGMGFSPEQLAGIAGKVDKVGGKAQARLDGMGRSGGSGEPSGGGGGGRPKPRPERPERDDIPAEGRSKAAQDFLEAQLASIRGDTQLTSLSPSLFENYRAPNTRYTNANSASNFITQSNNRWENSGSGTDSGDAGSADTWINAIDEAAASWRSTPEEDRVDQRQVVPESTTSALLSGGQYGSDDEEGWKRWFS